jgi:hypothetical protein
MFKITYGAYKFPECDCVSFPTVVKMFLTYENLIESPGFCTFCIIPHLCQPGEFNEDISSRFWLPLNTYA